jgi:hypothetical protein
MQKKQVIFISSGLAMLALVLIAAPTLASTTKNFANDKGFAGKIASFSHQKAGSIKPAAIGKISAISGSILTIAEKDKTYSVDASAAKITKGMGKNAEALTLADLTVGEMIFASGTVSGTNVAATAISVMDIPANGAVGQRGDFDQNRGVSGKVTAVNGSSFTIERNGWEKRATTTKQAVSFTVNTTNSTVFKKDSQSATLNDVATGEMVMVSGTIDTTSSTVAANTVNIFTKQAITPKKGNTGLANKFLNIFKKK